MVIVNSVHNDVIAWIRLHKNYSLLKETVHQPSLGLGFHVDVVAQLLSTETMTKNNYVTLSLYGEIRFRIYEGGKLLTLHARSQR